MCVITSLKPRIQGVSARFKEYSFLNDQALPVH
jgi:hypothetical protein